MSQGGGDMVASRPGVDAVFDGSLKPGVEEEVFLAGGTDGEENIVVGKFGTPGDEEELVLLLKGAAIDGRGLGGGGPAAEGALAGRGDLASSPVVGAHQLFDERIKVFSELVIVGGTSGEL